MMALGFFQVFSNYLTDSSVLSYERMPKDLLYHALAMGTIYWCDLLIMKTAWRKHRG